MFVGTSEQGDRKRSAYGGLRSELRVRSRFPAGFRVVITYFLSVVELQLVNDRRRDGG